MNKPLVVCEFCKQGFDPVKDRGSYSHDWATYKCSQCNDLNSCADQPSVSVADGGG